MYYDKKDMKLEKTQKHNYHILAGTVKKSVSQASSLHFTYSLYQILKESVKASIDAP